MENTSKINTERNKPWRDDLRKAMKSADRTKIERVVMPEQNPVVRAGNHIEVNLGLTPEQALNEAKRCLDCVDPTCITGCPVNIDIPKFIKHIEAGQFLMRL